MPLGASAGRSRNNGTGQGATRRNTQRERSAIDPVFPDDDHRLSQGEDDAAWVDTMMTWIGYASIIALGVLGGLILAAWFGVI